MCVCYYVLFLRKEFVWSCGQIEGACGQKRADEGAHDVDPDVV